jgi:hypothetical protein
MAATFALDRLSKMDSTTRWPLRTGEAHPLCSCGLLLTRCRPVSNGDYPSLEKLSDMAIKEKQRFERLVISKEKLLEMFAVSRLLLAHVRELNTHVVQQVQKVSHRDEDS